MRPLTIDYDFKPYKIKYDNSDWLDYKVDYKYAMNDIKLTDAIQEILNTTTLDDTWVRLEELFKNKTGAEVEYKYTYIDPDSLETIYEETDKEWCDRRYNNWLSQKNVGYITLKEPYIAMDVDEYKVIDISREVKKVDGTIMPEHIYIVQYKQVD